MRIDRQKFQQIRHVPRRISLLSLYSPLFSRLLFQDVQRYMPKDGEIFSGIAHSGSRLVFIELHAQNPVQLEGYHRFIKLVDEYADNVIKQTKI